ncbi:hypothetical protein D7B24_004099 [Verticillium nonalfalfae]|uniref:Fringe-like glycosyltransferase domain-containing protein n=1 Tax=Verticillium nonalfalfae TaxID=1051616 RepID=A0A3M9XW35_9PEZI|nr:uncharacterized protein D7B24_004099 [Verticillium nonalfalfae]RNJ52214.1 hypothetical protein D7B24_004099 [Verticillium nonalfalfae]
MNCNTDLVRVRNIGETHDLDSQVEYLKRYVRFTRKPIERLSSTSLQQSFLPDSSTMGQTFRLLDLSASNDHLDDQCNQEPLDVPVTESPFPADADLSDFMFAISTTFKRLSDPTTIQEWAYWLTSNNRSNGGKLLVQLVDATDAEITDVAARLAKVGVDAEVGGWDSRIEKKMAIRYLNLVPLLVSRQAANTKWFVLCDDDTFFTAMNGLVAKLKTYDPTQPHYVGTLSEDMTAVRLHGSQAFGGGGVFLSRPLAKIVAGAHASCRTPAKVKKSNSGWGAQGDILLRNCIYDNTDVRMTWMRDLWQLDLSGGDASGFYESGIKPFSIHHFRGGQKWHTTYPLNTTQIAHTCGEDCPYQRFVTADNFIISNGYSIAQYPDGIDFRLDQVERTFRSIHPDHQGSFDYTFGPQRPSLVKTGKKIAWDLVESQRLEDGSVSQVYVRKKDDERWTKEKKPVKAHDGVIELVWIPA